MYRLRLEAKASGDWATAFRYRRVPSEKSIEYSRLMVEAVNAGRKSLRCSLQVLFPDRTGVIKSNPTSVYNAINNSSPRALFHIAHPLAQVTLPIAVYHCKFHFFCQGGLAWHRNR